MSQSTSRSEPSPAAAWRMASISAWAVGSRSRRVRLPARPTASPSRRMTQPTGTSPAAAAARASASARSMNDGWGNGANSAIRPDLSVKRAMTRKSNDGKDGFKPRGPRDPRRARAGFASGRPSPGPKGPRGKPFRPQPPGGPAAPPAPKEAGRVAVNDRVIASPALNVTAADRITVDGAPLPARERTRLFLYHKPRGLVTTNADPEGRPTIFDELPKNLPRLLSVGRLDIGTEGLLLLTNDGGLARVLELPETGWLRRYRVRALGRVTQGDLDALRDGVTVDGIHYGAIEATLDREQGANVWLTFAIREGKNREVRNVLEHIGLQVNRLIRLSFGPFQLGVLSEGATDEINTRALRDQLGERITAQANCDFSGPLVERAPEPAPPVRRVERGARRGREERAAEPR